MVEEWERRLEEMERKCREVVERVFSKHGKRFRIERVSYLPITGKCIVDFVDRAFEPRMPYTCEEACDQLYEELEEYEECVRECEEAIESSKLSSVVFDPETLEVEEATVATECPWWGAETEEEEKAGREFAERFARVGCRVEPWSVEHLHPHEIAGLGFEAEEEAAVCYAHPTHLNGVKCKLDNLLKAL